MLSRILEKIRFVVGIGMSTVLAGLFVRSWFMDGFDRYDTVSTLFGIGCLLVAAYDWTKVLDALTVAIKKAHSEYRVVFRIEKRKVAEVIATSEEKAIV